MAGTMGAPLTMDFILHFEPNTSLRVGEKRQISSLGSRSSDGMEIRYFEYDVYCDPSESTGRIVQTAICRDMAGDGPELCRPGGLCSLFTFKIHPGLTVEYRGHYISIETAQEMPVGRIVAVNKSRMRLIGKMDLFACLPCCCFIPKLLDPYMMPWNQYDICDPDHEFGAPKAKTIDDRGGVELEKTNTSHSSDRPPPVNPASVHQRSASQFDAIAYKGGTTPSSKSSTPSPPTASAREADIVALKRLKSSGVLTHAEYISMANQVNSKYDAGTLDDMEALTKLYDAGVLSMDEYKSKRETIMTSQHKTGPSQ